MAFGGALLLTSLAALVSIIVSDGDPAEGPVFVTASTVLQDIAFVAGAVWLGGRLRRPRATDFGLRPTTLSRAVGWTFLAAVTFYGFVAAYSALLDPQGRQDTLEALGARQETALLITAAAVVILLAPFAEELLFRGFLYRALRNRLRPVSAALVVGAIFGSIHYTGPETLELLLPLAIFGFILCMLYERSGSLYPAIALHAINNAIAFATTADVNGAVYVAAGALALVLVACSILTARRGAPAAA